MCEKDAMCAKDQMERKMPLMLDIVVRARVSASPRHTPGRTRAPHTPPLQGKRRLCALLMLELSVSATSAVPTPVKRPRRGGWRVGRRLPLNGRPTANPARLAKKIFCLAGTGSALLKP
jgi:hypothetical protein